MSHDQVLECIEALYRTRLNDFRRVAAATTGSSDLADDAVQEAFVTAIRRRRQYRGAGSIEAWLWRVVVTSALKTRRSSAATRVRPPLLERASDSEASGELGNVREAVALLPERQRMVLFLRYYADLDYQTIGNVLEIRPGTVAAALNAAHATIRRRLEEVPVYE